MYAGAKGGVIAFTKSLAREVARFNINVNCVCPGPTDTPLLARVPERHREAFIKATPMRRLGKPSEVADAVLFFASDRASFITGQVLSVSGGLTMVD
jgi:2-hydroxycyclohexanecarboxyl-CoA dehydrogenase